MRNPSLGPSPRSHQPGWIWGPLNPSMAWTPTGYPTSHSWYSWMVLPPCVLTPSAKALVPAARVHLERWSSRRGRFWSRNGGWFPHQEGRFVSPKDEMIFKISQNDAQLEITIIDKHWWTLSIEHCSSICSEYQCFSMLEIVCYQTIMSALTWSNCAVSESLRSWLVCGWTKRPATVAMENQPFTGDVPSKASI